MRKLFSFLIISLVAMIVVACGSNNDNNTANEANNNNADNENNEEGSDSVVVEHELGETEVEKNPEKVVVFDFGSLDTLDELGIDVAGVAQKTVPSYLEKYEGDEYENIGSLKEPDFEKIAEIDPDLIIISGRQSDLYDQLQELGPTVYLGVDTENYMDSFKENAETIGEIFDKEDEVASTLDDIDGQVEEINELADESDQNGLIIMANDTDISAFGPGSRFGLVHDVFGVTPVDEGIESSTHGKNVSFEYVAEQDPDLLYVIDRNAAIGEDAPAEDIVENELMEGTKAMENDNIVYLHPDNWYLSGGGLESFQLMLDDIKGSLDN